MYARQYQGGCIMELYKEILINILAKEEINVSFSNLNLNAAETIESESYKTLQKMVLLPFSLKPYFKTA
jgi:type IV secretory pathway TrbL component